MTKRKAKHNGILLAGTAGVLVLTAIVVLLDPISIPVFGIVRTAAVLGYITCFLAILSSLYLRELVKYFGRPFVKVHHVTSLTSLAAIVTHGIFGAIGYYGTLSALLPSQETPQALALWLLVIAALAAFFRKAIGKRWKIVHWLNYIVFLMATLHAQTLGTNFQHWPVRVVSGLMAVGVIVVLVLKRLPKKRKTK